MRTIYWDGRVIEGFEEVEEIPHFWDYVDTTVPEALLRRDDQVTRQNLFGRLSEFRVQNIYLRYLEYAYAQCRVIAGTYMMRTLSDILSRFDGLTGVHFDLDGRRNMWDGETPLSFDHLSPVARLTLVELDGTHSLCTRSFWTLLGAIHAAGRARQLKYLSGQVDIAFWEQVVEACGVLTGLLCLSLENELMPCTDPAEQLIDAGQLLEQLSHADDLSALELRFSARRPGMEGALPVASLSSATAQMGSLRYLLLEGIVTSERELSELLRNHGDTLRRLRLESVRFERADAEDGKEPDCWIRFIHFLSD